MSWLKAKCAVCAIEPNEGVVIELIHFYQFFTMTELELYITMTKTWTIQQLHNTVFSKYLLKVDKIKIRLWFEQF